MQIPGCEQLFGGIPHIRSGGLTWLFSFLLLLLFLLVLMLDFLVLPHFLFDLVIYLLLLHLIDPPHI